MPYTIQSSEKTKAKGADFETKALLYLMNLRPDSDEIHYFVIDFFNDVTGLDSISVKAWDLQSKAAKGNYQGDIGKELVTLFKNFSSDFDFEHYILFLGGVADSIRKDNTKTIFDMTNITDKSITKIRQALIKECNDKSYIDNTKITDENINEFLNKVLFVIDAHEKCDYIKSIIKVNPLIIPSDIMLEKIFNQIRDAQSSKKNNNCIEGITINAKEEFVYYSRHLTSREIKMMVLNRLIGNGIMDKGVTPSFIPIYSRIPDTEKKDMLEDCHLNIAKYLFDKNNSENSWALFNNIYEVLTLNKSLTIDEAYKLLDKEILNKFGYLDMLPIKYFMAVIKDGVYEHH